MRRLSEKFKRSLNKLSIVSFVSKKARKREGMKARKIKGKALVSIVSNLSMLSNNYLKQIGEKCMSLNRF